MSIAGTTKIVNNGADLDHFVLVVAGDGFTAADQAAFEATTNSFVTTLQATPPFDEAAVWERINVYRLDVHSTESGADNPLSCPDDDPTYVHIPPESAVTDYEAAYCNYGSRRLLILQNEADLLADLDVHVPAWDAVVVAVNHQEYGGSGNDAAGVGVYSLDPLAAQIAIHEFAHVLGLEDEYDYDNQTYVYAEPTEPNVTTDLTASKWSTFLTAVNMPTWSSTNCAVSNEGVPDPEPGAVGLYEGAATYHCGIYRPTHDCMMRHLGVPFCVVCDTAIRDYLSSAFYFNDDACFVASAVYGDPEHPDVRTLRAWRDRHLAEDARGRWAMSALASAYRTIGPPCARATRQRPWLARSLRRTVFGPLASMLRRN